MGVQRSGSQVQAALEDIWHTLRGFDFRALMALQVEWKRHLKDDDYAAEVARVAARKVVRATADSDANAAGTTASKQAKSDSSASSGTGGIVGGATNAGKNSPPHQTDYPASPNRCTNYYSNPSAGTLQQTGSSSSSSHIWTVRTAAPLTGPRSNSSFSTPERA